MTYINSYILLFVCSMVATSLLTRLLIRYLASLGVVDVPSNRRSHDKVTPRGGGLAIVIVVTIAFSLFEYLTTDALITSIKIIPLLFVIAAVSFWDDLKPISAFIRLIVHLICSAFAVFFFLSPVVSLDYDLPLYIIFTLAVIALSGFTNIYNFMDGIDGISCMQSIHLSITMLLLCYLQSYAIANLYFIVTLSTIILGCCSGFLIFNWHPAKVFLGDIGSISLGFLTGLCLLLLSSSGIHLFIACFIAVLYYIADGGLTILIRLINKEKIWQPHLKHFFQKAVQNGKTHKQVVSSVAVCNIFLMILSVTSLYYPIISIMLALAVMLLTLVKLLK
ncbi:glycosyltransferase family 4 protein [Rickettsia endosymbiont of Polydrusus tereticollis]|uniref:MraY family glycosyltransferase n=1 Tax=Rickettsia endosymbiont of Polydrusus tereticollis TaxID=3066251 RepID=UPI003132F0DD